MGVATKRVFFPHNLESRFRRLVTNRERRLINFDVKIAVYILDIIFFVEYVLKIKIFIILILINKQKNHLNIYYFIIF